MRRITDMDLDALFWKAVRERTATSRLLFFFPIRRRNFDRSKGKVFGEYIPLDRTELRLRGNLLVAEAVELHASRFVDKAKFEVAKAIRDRKYQSQAAARSELVWVKDLRDDDGYMDDKGRFRRFLPAGGVKVFAPNGKGGEYQVRDVVVLAGTGRAVHPVTGEMLGQSDEPRVYQDDVGRVVLNVHAAVL